MCTRIEAITVPGAVVIKIGEASVEMTEDELKGVDLQEACLILCDKLERAGNLRDKPEPVVEPILEVEIVNTGKLVLDIDFDHDEEDIDLSLFEETVEIKW